VSVAALSRALRKDRNGPRDADHGARATGGRSRPGRSGDEGGRGALRLCRQRGLALVHEADEAPDLVLGAGDLEAVLEDAQPPLDDGELHTEHLRGIRPVLRYDGRVALLSRREAPGGDPAALAIEDEVLRDAEASARRA
jgi:hypothetical protein